MRARRPARAAHATRVPVLPGAPDMSDFLLRLRERKLVRWAFLRYAAMLKRMHLEAPEAP